MTKEITTKYIANGIVEVKEDFILCEEPMSRLVFHAQIHERGIKGKIIRQRRESKDDAWVPEKAIDIRSLGKNESINLEMNTESVKKLYLAIAQLVSILKEKGIEYGENHYAVVDPKSVIITDENQAAYIRKIIEAGYEEEVRESLTESNPDLVTKLSYARIQHKRKQTIDILSQRLNNIYPETSGPDSRQKWIFNNNRLFGVNYGKPIEKTKLNLSGIMPDYSFPTIDGFIDILEIKLPSDEVITEDASHTGAWKWTSETNRAIGQVVNYLTEIDRLRLEIERKIEEEQGQRISFLKPRAYILIGNSTNRSNAKKEALRKMNCHLHNIEIITYKELIDRGNKYISTDIL